VLEGVGVGLLFLAEHRRLAGRGYLGPVNRDWARRCRRYIVNIRHDCSGLGEGVNVGKIALYVQKRGNKTNIIDRTTVLIGKKKVEAWR
jgi:hypothetical protein